jgi:hypothetical protein
VAYRLQAAVHGDLDAASVRSLDRLAETGSEKSAPLPQASSVKPGTLLAREWDGVLHRVMALDRGFAWNGTSYRSLSEVARAGHALERTSLLRPARGFVMNRAVSTEHGLEQDFNSLDAQREAAEAYIKSQAHEGWVLVKAHYHDGGFSGGSMDSSGSSTSRSSWGCSTPITSRLCRSPRHSIQRPAWDG